MEQFIQIVQNTFEKYVLKNPVIAFFRRKVILRKQIIFGIMCLCWIGLIANAFLSPLRIVYTPTQLKTEKSYDNRTGKIVLDSQEYSKKNGIIVLNFKTFDYTSNIDKGINADNLVWNLYIKNGTSNTKMEVIPLINNNISVIIKNVPDNFEALAVDVKNTTKSVSDIDVSIEKYEDVKKEKTFNIFGNKNDNAGDDLQFLVAQSSKYLKEKTIKNISREDFALNIFKKEIAFDTSQVEKLENNIELLKQGIKQDNDTVKQLETEVQYLVGDNLEDKLSDIEDVKSSINNKELKIQDATENIATVNNKIDSLKNNVKSVKDGTYNFISPIRSIKKDF